MNIPARSAWIVPAVSALALYAVLEGAWLVTMKKRFYDGQLARYSRDGKLEVRSVAAAVFTYAVIALALWHFVLAPMVRELRSSGRRPDLWVAGLEGAALGAALYGVYNGTNKSTLQGYTWTMVAVDTAWGAASLGAAAIAFAFALGAGRNTR